MSVWTYRLRCRSTDVLSSYHDTITSAVKTAHIRAEESQEDLEIVRANGEALTESEQQQILSESIAAFELRAAGHRMKANTCQFHARQLRDRLGE